MKKLFLAMAFLMPLTIFAEGLDSLQTEQAINVGLTIVSKVISTYVPVIPADLILALLTVITGIVHRIWTIRKWKKNGKLTTPPYDSGTK